VGVEIVADEDALAARGEALLAEAGRLLVERFVRGRELTLPVVEREDGEPEAFPCVEIRPRSATFFDYVAKYTPGASDEICPAPIPEALEARLRALGVAAHRALGCRGYSRSDCIVADDDEVFLLEVNTLPGLTRESLLPLSAATAGVSFPDLIERLLRRAVAGAPV
jgi:D-alanine-D-alanine ligase